MVYLFADRYTLDMQKIRLNWAFPVFTTLDDALASECNVANGNALVHNSSNPPRDGESIEVSILDHLLA